ncbi:hypothetical protein EVAR_5515_1 [Eumeta japonica]|uniref:RNA-directed DNA polymerase from mobile element jockey n=1 Tax=Eumeta variegata TaxID=151549 RepID=A0A4C1T9V4_EUMVA|nr:hypothetical protein EVAR_5515_1 [Eumeta japonica]
MGPYSISMAGRRLLKDAENQGYEVLGLDTPTHIPTDLRHRADVLDIVLCYRLTYQSLHSTVSDNKLNGHTLLQCVSSSGSNSGISVLHYLASEKNCGGYMVVVVLDMEKAFDREWYAGLLYARSGHGIEDMRHVAGRLHRPIAVHDSPRGQLGQAACAKLWPILISGLPTSSNILICNAPARSPPHRRGTCRCDSFGHRHCVSLTMLDENQFPSKLSTTAQAALWRLPEPSRFPLLTSERGTSDWLL